MLPRRRGLMVYIYIKKEVKRWREIQDAFKGAGDKGPLGDVASLSVWRRTQHWRLGSAERVSNKSQPGLLGEHPPAHTVLSSSEVSEAPIAQLQKPCYLKVRLFLSVFWKHFEFMGQFAQCSICLLIILELRWCLIWVLTVETSVLLLCD